MYNVYPTIFVFMSSNLHTIIVIIKQNLKKNSIQKKSMTLKTITFYIISLAR